MSLALRALTAEPWAIEPSWLPLLAALAQRNASAPEVEAAKEYQKRDYDLMAGPGAQKLAGSYRSYAVDGVAVIPVTGPIFPRANMMTEMSGATSVTMLQNDYRAALNNADIGAIMLLVDSPGGAVSGINAFADAVFAGSKKKRTIAFVAGQACSAAYWIASSASEIVLERTGIVGSIGVVVAMAKQKETDANGYLDIEIVSSNAPNKRPDPESEEGRGEIVSMLDSIEALFIADVARGRGVSATKVKSDFKQGGVEIGAAAVALGMADRVQSQEATLGVLRRSIASQRKLQSLKQ